MTPQEKQAILDAATPRPWVDGSNGYTVTGPTSTSHCGITVAEAVEYDKTGEYATRHPHNGRYEDGGHRGWSKPRRSELPCWSNRARRQLLRIPERQMQGW